MNENSVNLLEYDKIKENLSQYALSEQGKAKINRLLPAVDRKQIEHWLLETTEAVRILDINSSVPIHSLKGIEELLDKLGKGIVLQPQELMSLAGFLREGQKLKRFMADKTIAAPMVSSYVQSIDELHSVADEIEICIYNGVIHDQATPALAKIRKRIRILETRIKDKLQSILKSDRYHRYLQDSVISVRGGRYVLPIKSEHKKQFSGHILDTSGSGSTVFIEPVEVKKIHDELNLLKIEEEKEVYKILSTLTVLVEDHEREIKINVEVTLQYDFLFAKAKYSRVIGGYSVKLNEENVIHIKQGKHPLLGSAAVPLDFVIGRDYRSLVITGPNTGGKTVALKTVGLLTIMVQSGLHVPVAEGSEFAIFADILVDIGDGQSIEQSLSTFSAHIKNIIRIIECADPYTLVILDELGAGTDPAEGKGIALAVLEELYRKGATTLASTHYSEIKDFAAAQPGFENGCMAFDLETLKPLYQLIIGQAGQSNALFIALKLGMRRDMIERAHELTYGEKKAYDEFEIRQAGPSPDAQPEVAAHEVQVRTLQKKQKAQQKLANQDHAPSFKIGDSVYISTMERNGIVYEVENSKGEVGVMVMKKKFKINKKRLSLHIAAEELYPEDYDFDILFETKENRKKRKLMKRKYVEGLEIEVSKED